MKLNIILTMITCFLLQSCTAQEEIMLKKNTVLFFDPLYYLSHSQGPCIEKRDVIECNWNTQSITILKTGLINHYINREDSERK